MLTINHNRLLINVRSFNHIAENNNQKIIHITNEMIQKINMSINRAKFLIQNQAYVVFIIIF